MNIKKVPLTPFFVAALVLSAAVAIWQLPSLVSAPEALTPAAEPTPLSAPTSTVSATLPVNAAQTSTPGTPRSAGGREPVVELTALQRRQLALGYHPIEPDIETWQGKPTIERLLTPRSAADAEWMRAVGYPTVEDLRAWRGGQVSVKESWRLSDKEKDLEIAWQYQAGNPDWDEFAIRNPSAFADRLVFDDLLARGELPHSRAEQRREGPVWRSHMIDRATELALDWGDTDAVIQANEIYSIRYGGVRGYDVLLSFHSIMHKPYSGIRSPAGTRAPPLRPNLETGRMRRPTAQGR